jgi:two-component system, cell cycle sensor histidine kinase and response regulator CckA
MRWNLPLRYSIPILLGLVSVLLSAFAFYDGLTRTESLIEDEMYSRTVAFGTRISGAMEMRYARGESQLAESAVLRAANEPHLRREIVFDPLGRIVVSTDYALRDKTLQQTDAEIDLAPLVKQATATMAAQYQWTSDRKRLYGLFPLNMASNEGAARAKQIGVLLVEIDLTELRRLNLVKHVQRAWIMGTAILLSLALIWFYVDSAVTRRLQHMADAIEKSAHTEGAVASISGVDELGRFGRSIERIVGELHARSRALIVSESRYRSIIHAMSEGVVIQRHDGTIVAWNESATRVLGLTEDQLHGRTSMDPRWRAVHEDGSPFPGDTHPAMATLRTGVGQTGVVMGVHRPDDSLRWISINSEPVVLDAARGDRGVVTTFSDITGRREAELQGQRDRERLAAIVGSAMDGVICTDADMRITLFNRAAENIFGFCEAAMLGNTLEALLPERFRHGHHGLMQQFSVSASSKRSMGTPGEVVGLRANGEEFPLEASISRVNLGNEVVLTVILRDISERKRAQLQREQLEAQLRQSQKMQSLGTLTGGIAHDFNNILTAISGNAKLAQIELQEANMPVPSPARRSLTEIEKAAARATDLVRQVLTFSRRQEARRALVDLAAVVAEALRFLRSMLPAMIEIRSHLPDNLPLVAADSTQVHQVITNLGSNAAHAIGDQSGVIDVKLEAIELTAEQAQVSADLHAGRYVRLVFTDSGSGIDPATLDRIFEPFFTTKGLGQGTGLGLSVVHGIMKNHDGAIFVDSQPGAGSRFQLYFPVGVQAAVTQQTGGTPKVDNQVPGVGKTIVYIDDEEALVFLVTRILERRGYIVLGYTDAKAALAEIAKLPASIDAVVSDLAMPGMTGFDVVRKVHELRADLPVVLVSGYVRPQDAAQAHQLGVQRLILKPDTVDALAQALHEVLQKSEGVTA